MHHTEFLRSDEPGEGVALGYLDSGGPRTNVLHLPVVGSGDGGIYSTAADIHALWVAVFAGRIVPTELVDAMVAPRSEYSERYGYGLGFWLQRATGAVEMEGFDAGASFRSARARDGSFTYTILSNTSQGADPIVEVLQGLVLE